MAGEYVLSITAGIDEFKSNAKIQEYINKIKSKVATDASSQIKITVTPNIVEGTDAMGRAVSVRQDMVKVTQDFTNNEGAAIKQVGMFTVAEDGATEKIKENTTYTQKAATAQANFGAEIQAVIRRTLESALTLGIMYGALKQLKDGIQYVIDLNKEMTSVQMVTGQSDEDIQKLAVSYNKLGKELSVSTLEIAKGSLEWIRQGKTAEETAQLLRQSTMLSKLGNIDAATSTDRLTSIMNGFKLEVKDVSGVVDKLVGLDNAFATSVDEISNAMKYSSNSARAAGVDFDHLAAYITVISSVSRKSSETVGQSMKTMLARMTDIKSGRIDEDGLGINNVADALKRVNIDLMDETGNFKDMQVVIDELGKKWDRIGDIDQKNIAKMVAGKQRMPELMVTWGQNIFISLMNLLYCNVIYCCQ